MKVGLTNIELNIVIPGLIPGDGDLLEAGVRRLLGVGEGGVHDGLLLLDFCIFLLTVVHFWCCCCY